MNEMYKRIEDLCKEKGVNMTQMCREAGIPRSNLSDLKFGITAALATLNLSRLATYFDVSMDYLLGHEETKKAPTPQRGERDYPDADLVEAFYNADEATRAAIRLLLKL